MLRSNRWPGAYSYAKDDRFANIYIGYGIKYTGEPYSPPLPSIPLNEQDQPEEHDDPTIEEEEEYEKLQKQAQQTNENPTDNEEEDDYDNDEQEEEEQ